MRESLRRAFDVVVACSAELGGSREVNKLGSGKFCR